MFFSFLKIAILLSFLLIFSHTRTLSLFTSYFSVPLPLQKKSSCPHTQTIEVTCPKDATSSNTCNDSTGLGHEPALVNDPGLCGKVVDYETDLVGEFSFEYSCGDICIDLSHESGTFFPVGETVTVDYKVTGSDGEEGSCSFDIEVVDVEVSV